jgi:large subunit ribosomal protein L25
VTDFVINAEERTVLGKKVKQLRNDGIVPVTVYGPNIAPVNLQVPYRPLEVALMKAGGTNIIDMKVGGKTLKVLARDVQRNPIKGFILHVDFFAIDADSKITTAVPVQFIGESPAVSSGKGILTAGINNITVETLPSKLINVIEVDLSTLEKVGDAITVADLDLGDDVTVLSDSEETIVRIAQSAAARRQEMLDGSDTSSEGDEASNEE